MTNYLADELLEYAKSDMYPFHMPGHKRKKIDFPEPFSIDITEIDGFDNLHHPEGILKDAQDRAAKLYGSKRCFYLVNGSTCGLLAAICGATRKGDKVLVARNSHKAVYHALFLNELQAEYLYPRITNQGIQGQITVEQVEKAIYDNPDISAIIITSPTYEGIVSDVAGIAEAAHEHGIPLIVDEAHGAHFGFGAGFPENAVKLGADAVIMSLHKTLPSFTQTALLHICSDRIDMEKVEQYLGIFETSSPSYLFMAGMDSCIRLVSERKKELFSNYRKLLDDFYQKTADLKYIKVLRAEDFEKEEAYDWDDSKLVIFSEQANLTGEELHEILLKKYLLQMEMVSGYYVLGMTSLMDEEAGMNRLSAALHEIDASVEDRSGQDKKNLLDGNQASLKQNIDGRENQLNSKSDFIEKIYQKNPLEMQMYQAMQLTSREISMEEAIGQMSADTIFLYPPGIPMIVPGEVITKQLIGNIQKCKDMGLRVEGASNIRENRIKIVYF